MYLPTDKTTKQYTCVCGKGKSARKSPKSSRNLEMFVASTNWFPTIVKIRVKEMRRFRVEIDPWQNRFCTYFSLKKEDCQ